MSGFLSEYKRTEWSSTSQRTACEQIVERTGQRKANAQGIKKKIKVDPPRRKWLTNTLIILSARALERGHAMILHQNVALRQLYQLLPDTRTQSLSQVNASSFRRLMTAVRVSLPFRSILHVPSRISFEIQSTELQPID